MLHFGQHLTHVVLHCFTRTICNLQRVNDGPDNHERQPIGDQDKQRRQQADRAEDRPPFEFWRQWPRSSTLPIDSQIGERARRKRRILPGTSDINNINACNVIYVLVHSFTKVNIREVEGVQLMFDIKETPTFVFIKYEEQIDEEVATQHTVNKKLENLIKKYNKKHMCQRCNRTFNHGFQLNQHLTRTCTDDLTKKFLCQKCPFGTNYGSNLHKHVALHCPNK